MTHLPRRLSGPVVTVDAEATVLESARVMDTGDIGAVVVEERGAMVGIFSERDLLRRVIAAGRDPAATRVRDVMSAPVLSMSLEAGTDEAVDAMIVRHIRHVPVVNEAGKPVAMVSFRGAMADRIDDLEHELYVLEAYLGNDGAAG